MNKKNKGLSVFLAILSSIILFVGVYILGILLGNKLNLNINIWIPLAIVDVLFMLLFLLNASRTKKYNNQLQAKNGEEMLSTILEKKDEALKNYESNYKRVIASYKKVCMYTISFYIFQILLVFVNGFAFKVFNHLEEIEVAGLYIAIIGSLLLISIGAGITIFYALFMKLFDKGIEEIKYPLTYQFIKDIFAEEGINKEIEINLIDDVNVGISEKNNIISIAIGVVILKFFTKEEIRAVIYHEIAHYKQEHTKLTQEKEKYTNLLNVLLPYSMYFFIYPKMSFVIIDNEILQLSTSIAYETQADNEVLNKNVGDAYARVAIKLFGLTYAYRIPRYDIEYALSKKHQWDDETIQQYFDRYLSFYNQHQGFFLFASKNHLESRLPTHPNVKQRVEKFASKEVDPLIVSSNYFDEDIRIFYNEINEKVLKKEKVEVFDHFIQFYDEYTSKKEAAIESNFNIELNKVQALMDQAFQCGEMEFAKSCALKVLEVAKDNSRAHLILGMILAFYEFSDDCISHLQLVFEEKNSQFVTTAFDALGEYATITGKLELRNSLRELIASTYDNEQALEYVLRINLNDKLIAYSNETVVNKVIEIAKDNEDILEICIGTKQKENNSCHHVILFIQDKLQDEKKFEETKTKIWAFLDLENDQYNLTVVPIKIIPANHKFRKQPLNVYKR